LPKTSESVGIHAKGEIGLPYLLEILKRNADFRKAGAVATFTGVVRGFTSEGKTVTKLEYQVYEEKALQSLEKIRADLLAMPGIVEVMIHHLIGSFSAGEEVVYVIVAGRSRADVFPVLERAIERLKLETPIWKKEYTIDDSYWVGERMRQTVER
jgi:molybdopterin synthase catalytic subunit